MIDRGELQEGRCYRTINGPKSSVYKDGTVVICTGVCAMGQAGLFIDAKGQERLLHRDRVIPI